MGTPPSGDAEPRGLCKVLPVQRPHHPLGALWLVLLQEDPPGSGDWGLIQRGKEVHVYRGGGLIAWRSLPRPSAPLQPSLGTQAYSGSRDVTSAQVPSPEENRIFFFFFCLSIFATYFELEYIDNLHCGGFCFVLFFRCTATWIIYTWLLCSFSASFPM